MKQLTPYRILAALALLAAPYIGRSAETIELKQDTSIALIGGGLGSRMTRFGLFETEVQLRHPDLQLTIRNLCDEGDTPGFRPHSGRPSPWAFPGAEEFYPPLSEAKDRWGSGHTGYGDFETPDEWLTRVEADMIIAFFGYSESYRGREGLAQFREELRAFVKHTLQQRYNGESAPRLVLVAPLSFEDLSKQHGTPDGIVENANLAIYSGAIENVAQEFGLLSVNPFGISHSWFYISRRDPLTRDGVTLKRTGYEIFSTFLADSLFGPRLSAATEDERQTVLEAVNEKNWMWSKFYKIPNGVHVFGRRHRPFGPENYPSELKKLEEMTANRDRAIWAALQDEPFDLAAADAETQPLPEIETNYRPSAKNGTTEYLYGDDALETFTVAEGYQIELFASEQQFEELANPVQLSFDNAGRLWVATMPTYPHYRPGDAKPNDKLIILEDTDQDGKADELKVFADNLHLPTGFEFAPDGVYVAQGTHLMLLKDTDQDDVADVRETVLSGFDDHDTHHVISAFCADPSGAIYMGEGTFLHSNVETAYGTIRSSNGGFFRFDPVRRKLERSARLSIPNPWGTAFDDWGQIFFLDTSDPALRWMVPGTVSVPYGSFAPNPPNIIENAHRVRPTSGLEFISSRHFPDEVQGDILLNNTIGFLGIKQHTLSDDGAGYTSSHRQDLLTSSDGNFRPVDLEFAPDGSLYLVDWHNVLVGHMQHSARDPLRDHVHGRIYRITYPSRPLVEPARIAGASLEDLFKALEVPEYRTRYRARREIREWPTTNVADALRRWVASLNPSDPNYTQHLIEALWVSWGIHRVEPALVARALVSTDHRARAAAIRVIRYCELSDAEKARVLSAGAIDPSARVRLETVAAASWMKPETALPIIQAAANQPEDELLQTTVDTALASLQGLELGTEEPTIPETTLTGVAKDLYEAGAEIFHREGSCVTCHQEDGKGLPAAQFPPLAGSEWVVGDQTRLIKLTLNGLMGPIEVKGKTYPGLVPMTPFKGLSDTEIASVLTFVRNSFGNEAHVIDPRTVGQVRGDTFSKVGFYDAATLLAEHPFEDE